MRKILLLSAVAAMLLFSCKKEHSGTSTSPMGKKYQVTFNVTNFAQKQTSFAVRYGANNLSDTLSNLNSYFDVLYYVVYNQPYPASPKVVTQDSTMSNMGMLTDSLAPGTYDVIIIAGKKGLTIDPTLLYKSGDATFGYGGKWQDAFFYQTNLTVSSGNMSQEVTLHRIVGKLELQITDNIPATADSISMTINPELTNKYLQTGLNDAGSTSAIVTFSEAIPASAKGNPNFIMDRIIGNNYESFTVTITCKNASNTVLGTTTVNGVTCIANEKTILSGKLFGSNNTQSFTAKIDTTWTNNSNQYSF